MWSPDPSPRNMGIVALLAVLAAVISAGNACFEIRQPQAFRQAGYYPTQYCVRQNQKGERTVSLERFRFSQAS